MTAIVQNVAGEGSGTETLLLDLWKRVLRVPAIGRDDNFFDLGGDSLLAVNLFLEVERETGINCPITAIYDAPTIAEMAVLIDGEAAPQSSSLVLLKPGTGERPFYVVHGIGGTVIELAALGRAIRIPDAVYAIQARGLDGRDPPLATVADMADRYVKEVRTVQPRGPYRLCGYSFGGLVAMEMARRLEAEGERIDALILIDSYGHPSTWPLLSRLKMRLRRAAHLLSRARLSSAAMSVSRLVRRSREVSSTRRLHDWLLDHNPSLPMPLLRVREAGGAALCSYSPAPYTGPLTFLKAATGDVEFPDDPERIWRHLAPRAVFRTIAGGHRTIVTDHAATAAEAISEWLHRSPPRRMQCAGEVLRSRGGGD